MNKKQLTEDLNDILYLLNERQGEIDTIHEKFQVALTGILRLIGETTPTLTNLHGKTEDLTGYLIQLNSEVIKTTSESYQSLRIQIERVIESVSTSDRKS
jgi:hypothetical protein